MFLNHRDAFRYRDLKTFLPGLEIFLKPYNLDILLNKSFYLVILANYLGQTKAIPSFYWYFE